jgi:uncharacterized protein (TIRG00374 family)
LCSCPCLSLTAKVARGALRPRLEPDAVRDAVFRCVDRVRQLVTDRRTLTISTPWAAVNGLPDVTVVVVIAMTIGHGAPLAPILPAYIVAQLAASLPFTPGGVGIVEAARIGAMVTAGAPAAAATVTVLGLQFVSHWLPIVVGLGLPPKLTGHRRQSAMPSEGPSADELGLG